MAVPSAVFRPVLPALRFGFGVLHFPYPFVQLIRQIFRPQIREIAYGVGREKEEDNENGVVHTNPAEIEQYPKHKARGQKEMCDSSNDGLPQGGHLVLDQD